MTDGNGFKVISIPRLLLSLTLLHKYGIDRYSFPPPPSILYDIKQKK